MALSLEAYEMTHMKNYDVCVLVAGDSDYTPLVQKIQATGTRVMVLGWEFDFVTTNVFIIFFAFCQYYAVACNKSQILMSMYKMMLNYGYVVTFVVPDQSKAKHPNQSECTVPYA